jgi:hypothetical protein
MPDRNSKRTRVEPVFAVLERLPDPTWVQRLIDLSAGMKAPIKNGSLLSLQFRTERKVDPNVARLAWMLRNWPRLVPSDGSRYREYVRRMSDEDAISAALQRLDTGDRSVPAKMILEGPSSADCLIECESAIIWVEGKRDDWLANGTSWDVCRDQLARNVEAAWLMARDTGREYCLIIAFEDELKHHEAALIEGYRTVNWAAGWPHLDEHQRREFAQRIGTIRWRDIATEWPDVGQHLENF